MKLKLWNSLTHTLIHTCTLSPSLSLALPLSLAHPHVHIVPLSLSLVPSEATLPLSCPSILPLSHSLIHMRARAHTRTHALLPSPSLHAVSHTHYVHKLTMHGIAPVRISMVHPTPHRHERLGLDVWHKRLCVNVHLSKVGIEPCC